MKTYQVIHLGIRVGPCVADLIRPRVSEFALDSNDHSPKIGASSAEFRIWNFVAGDKVGSKWIPLFPAQLYPILKNLLGKPQIF